MIGNATAQDAPPVTGPAQFQVLQTRQVYVGNRWIIMNRVAPPATTDAGLTSQPSGGNTATPSPTTTGTDTSGGDTNAAPLPYQLFMLTAAVYNGQISELRWNDESGAHHAYANFDFHYVAQMGSIQTSSAQYQLIFAVWNGASSDPGAQLLPALSQFPAQSAILLAPDNATAPSAASTDALSALAESFDANSAGLIADYQAKAAAAQAAASNPPAPQNIVINFWPIQSNVYSTAPGSSTTSAANGGGK